jgi:hypothetical protein
VTDRRSPESHNRSSSRRRGRSGRRDVARRTPAVGYVPTPPFLLGEETERALLATPSWTNASIPRVVTRSSPSRSSPTLILVMNRRQVPVVFRRGTFTQSATGLGHGSGPSSLTASREKRRPRSGCAGTTVHVESTRRVVRCVCAATETTRRLRGVSLGPERRSERRSTPAATPPGQ